MPRSSTPEEPPVPAPSGTGDGAFESYNTLGLLKFIYLTGLHRFNPKVYSLQPPCLRLTHAVTDISSRLGMECAGSTLFQGHFQPPAVGHFVAHYRKYKGPFRTPGQAVAAFFAPLRARRHSALDLTLNVLGGRVHNLSRNHRQDQPRRPFAIVKNGLLCRAQFRI